MVGFDMNSSGVLAGDAQINSRTSPVRWTAEAGREPLDVGPDGRGGFAYDINEAGAVVGQVDTTSGPRPALWQPDGTLVELGMPDWRPYSYARAHAINDAGTVIGAASLTARDENGVWRTYNDPFLWTAEGGFRKLAHLGDNPAQTVPIAINNHGYVAGQSLSGNAPHMVLWHRDGTVEDLGVLPGMSSSHANAINDGTVVGASGDDAVVWTREDGLRRLPDYGFDGEAIKVTADGWILGSAQVDPESSTPVVWDPQGRIYDVAEMVDWEVMFPTDAMAINDAHQVVVYGFVPPGGSGNALLRLPALP
jgi:uncharacterized membrane protein